MGLADEGKEPRDRNEPDDEERPGLVIGPTSDASDVQVVAGRHAGRPPAEGRRADVRIEQDVRRWLDGHGTLDARGIRVEVSDGEVILDGVVADQPSRRVAETIAESVSGVRRVTSRLGVSGRPGGAR
jgi:osmotically-inducible protein OsmY